MIITSSSASKLERAGALGADEGVNYKDNPDWDKAVLELTRGYGADHVLDTGGAGTLPRSYRVVARNGIVDVIGAMTRPEGDLTPYALMAKSAMVRGIAVGTKDQFEAMLKALEVNRLHPVIDRAFDFEKAPEAFQHLKAGAFGKVVITI